MSDAFQHRSTVAGYLAVLRRRKWIVALPLVLAPIAAVWFSTMQSPLYQATAEVLVQPASIVSSITAVNPTSGDPARFLTTQSDIARNPELIGRVVAAAGVPGVTVGRLLADSQVSARSDADVLDISVKAANPFAAAQLTDTYATELTSFKTEFDTARVNEAIASIKTRIAALTAHGVPQTSPAYATLQDYQGRLETIGKLLADNTKVLGLAHGASKIRPRPRRDGILGVLLGAILGLGLAFLAEALDRRVRSEHEIEEALDVPLLARVTKPPRRLRKVNHLVMLAEPMGVQAEAFRKLRTNIEFLHLAQDARTIMVTSAVQREGKSTTVANLAVALARKGRRVALVDLDLRRPFLHRFFDTGPVPGMTDVVLNRVRLVEALRPIPLPVVLPESVSRGHVNGRRAAGKVGASRSNGHKEVEGVLSLLPAGATQPSPGEFVESEGVAAVLAALSERFDFVLVDAPPLLAVGDALTLSAKVDAVFAVARLTVVQRPVLHELARQLESCPARNLGFVLTGAEQGESYGYGDVYGYTQQAESSRDEQAVN